MLAKSTVALKGNTTPGEKSCPGHVTGNIHYAIFRLRQTFPYTLYLMKAQGDRIMKVRLTTTLGSIVLELDNKKAPNTVNNFVAYATSGHYDGTIFHRVIDDFVIQGGGFDSHMKEKPARPPIRNEANNRLSNLLGSIAMARTPEPHSASAQFFINTNDNAFLDFSKETDDGWGYCVFGKVIEGIEVVEQIEEAPTTTRDGHEGVPVENIVIEKAEIIT